MTSGAANYTPLGRNDSAADLGGTEPKAAPYVHSILSEHDSTVYAVAYAPDGKCFATADTAGKRTLLWDAQTKKLIREFKCGDQGRVYGIAISPDGKLLATSDYDNKVAYTWDMHTGELKITFKGHTAGVWPVAFSPDSLKLLTGAWDSTAKIWDANTGKPETTLKGHQSRLMAVAWCPDGHQVATASFDSTLRTWEAETGDPMHVYHPNETGEGLTCVQYAPDGTTLIVGSDDGGATLFQVNQGKEARHEKGALLNVLEHRSAPANTSQCNRDRLLQEGHKTGNILTFEESKGNTRKPPAVKAVTYSADGRKVACAYDDKEIRIWDLALSEIVQRLVGHTKGPVWSLAFAPSGTQLLTGGADKAARVWDTVHHGEYSATFDGHKQPVTAIACAPDGKSFVSSSFDNSARVWGLDKDVGQEQFTHVVQAPLISAHYSPDGTCYAFAGYNQDPDASFLVSIFDTNHKEMNSIKLDAKVQALKFSPDSSKLAIALEDKSARIWTVGRTSKETHRLGPNPNGETGPSPAPGGHTWIVASIDWHPQGTKVVTGSWDSTAIVWDVSSSKPKPTIVLSGAGRRRKLHGCAFSADGTRIITGSEDRTARVWDAETGEELYMLGKVNNADPMEGHVNQVWGVGFHPKQIDTVYTGGFDGDVKLWKLQEQGAQCIRTVSLSGPATSITVLPVDTGLQLLCNSGRLIFKLVFSQDPCPTICAEDLYNFTILPDLEDGKAERLKKLATRMGGTDHSVDNTGSLLQCIGPHGETALHLALEHGNLALAKELLECRGGRTALVVSMDNYCRTPWSIAMMQNNLNPKNIDKMSEVELDKQLGYRFIPLESVSNLKQKRDVLKLYKEDNYKELQATLQVEDSLMGVSGGAFYAVAEDTRTLATDINGEQHKPENMAPTTMLQTLTRHCELVDSPMVFDTPLAKNLVQCLWDGFARERFFKECRLYVLLIICYTMAFILSQDICDHFVISSTGARTTAVLFTGHIPNELAYAANALPIILILRFISREGLQLYKLRQHGRWWEYFMEPWNFAQCGSYLLTLTSMIVHSRNVYLIQHDSDNLAVEECVGLRELHALAGGTLWLGALFYLRAFKATENALPILAQIVVDVWPYLVVLSSILVGCAFIFMNLQRTASETSEVIVDKYYTAPASLLSAFSMMMGGFDTADFASSNESAFVFVTFMVFVQLVMLNMLIAIMGDSVASVKAQGEASGDAARADLVVEISTFMTREDAEDRNRFPRTFTLAKDAGKQLESNHNTESRLLSDIKKMRILQGDQFEKLYDEAKELRAILKNMQEKLEKPAVSESAESKYEV